MNNIFGVCYRLLVMFASLLFLRCVAYAEAEVGAQNKAIWITSVFEPWVIHRNGEYGGQLYELVRRGFAGQGIDVEVKETAVWRARLTMLDREGDFIVWPKVLIPPVDDVAFHSKLSCDTLLMEHSLYAFGRVDKFDRAISKSDFKDYSILARPLPDEIKIAMMGDIDYQKVVSPTASLIQTLLSGRVDIVVAAGEDIMYSAKKLGVSDKLVIVHDFDRTAQYQLCFSKSFLAAQPKSFLGLLEHAISRIQSTPDYVADHNEFMGADLVRSLVSEAKSAAADEVAP